MLLELDEEDRLLVVRGHKLALRVPARRWSDHDAVDSMMRSQSPAAETRYEIGNTLALDADVRGQDVVAHRQSDRLHNHAGCVQDGRQ